MATSSETSYVLGIGYEYTRIDEEENKTIARTVYVKVPNPKDNLTESQIRAAGITLINGATPILLDPYGNPFESDTAIITAYTETQEIINVDTGYED